MIKTRPLALVAVFMALACFFVCKVSDKDIFPEKIEKDAVCVVEGKVSWIEEKEKRCDIRLEGVKITDGKGRKYRYSGILVIDKKDADKWIAAGIGRRVKAECSCVRFDRARNYGNFDEKQYYNSLGLKEKLEYRSGFEEKSAACDLLRNILFRLRRKIIRIFKDAQGEDGKDRFTGIMASLVSGDRSGISPEQKELYQDSGIAHVLAISGLHISLIGLTTFSFLKKRAGFKTACIVSAGVMIAYCILTGSNISAIRAGGMFILRIAALRTGRRFDILTALSFMAVIILAENPAAIYNSGFLLSFGAVLGIAVCTDTIKSFLCIKEGSRLGEAFAASLGATLFTLPFIAATFFQVPLLAVFINMAVIPLMSIVLGSGLAMAAAGFIGTAAARIAAGAGAFCLLFIEVLCTLINSIPFAVVITGNVPVIRGTVYYAVLLAALGICRKAGSVYGRQRLKRAALSAASVAVLVLILAFRLPDGKLKIMFMDVGQGDGILIRSGSGVTYMIDGGSSSTDELYRYKLESALKYNAVKIIDYAIITHTDMDHMSGVLEMLDDRGAGSIRIKNILVPDIENNTNHAVLVNKAKEKNINVIDLHTGHELNEKELRLKCLHPDTDFRTEDVNGYSAVIELEYGAFKAIFTGDMETDGERLLLDGHRLSGDYDLLKVAHHGSKSSSGEAFIGEVSPSVSVVSAGENNIYGHPSPEVVERLKKSGSKLYVTAKQGQINIEVDKTGKMAISTKLERATA